MNKRLLAILLPLVLFTSLPVAAGPAPKAAPSKGPWLVAALLTGRIFVWDVVTGRELLAMKTAGVALSPGTLVNGTPKGLEVWDLATARRTLTIDLPWPPRHIAVSDKYVAVFGRTYVDDRSVTPPFRDGALRVYDRAGKLLHEHASNDQSSYVALDGEQLFFAASSLTDGRCYLHVLSAPDGRRLLDHATKGDLRALSIGPAHAAFVEGPHRLTAWDRTTGEVRVLVSGDGHNPEAVKTCSVSGEVTAGLRSNRVWLWSAPWHEPRPFLPVEQVRRSSLSGDDLLVATESGFPKVFNVKLFSASTGALRGEERLPHGVYELATMGNRGAVSVAAEGVRVYSLAPFARVRSHRLDAPVGLLEFVAPRRP
jgi:hypothetical protein